VSVSAADQRGPRRKDTAMQYLLSVIDDGTTVDAPEVAEAIDAVNDRFRAGGHWVFANGLGEPSTATTVDTRGATPIITDGPFVETKEYIAGMYILEAADLDEALELAKQASTACDRRIEVRPFHS
jgi:hypothetical protein